MTDGDRIECRVTPWYFRRMSLMALLLVGCGCWFLYDGLVGWPKANHRADIYDAFQAGREETLWEEFLGEMDWPGDGPGEEAMAELKEAYNAGASEETWGSFSAARRLDEKKPKRHPQSAIEGQFHWAYGAFIIGGIVLVVMVINAPKKLTADSDAFYTPGNVRVPFDGIFKVDKRKWDNKGLAYTYYREGNSGVKKATIDDLKYKGADRILARVLEKFEGELIERAPVDDDEEEDEADEGVEGEAESDAGEGGDGESATAGKEAGKKGVSED